MTLEYKQVKDWLDRDFPMSIKANIFSFIFIHIFIGILITTSNKNTFSFLSLYILWNIIAVMFFLIWGIVIIIKKSKIQLTLFIGIVGSSLSLFNLKLFYDMFESKLNIFFIISIIFYVIFIILCYLFLNYNFKIGFFSGKEKNQRVVYGVIAFIIIIGSFIFKLISMFGSENLQNKLLSLVPLIMAYCFILLGFGGIYKFYLLRKFRNVKNN